MRRALEYIIKWRSKPVTIRFERGSEYISNKRIDWANGCQITLVYFQAGKSTQNVYIERVNRAVRREGLEMHVFESIEHAQYLAAEWL